MVVTSFNTNDPVPKSEDFKPIPAGRYIAVLDEEKKFPSSKNPANIVINLKFRIIEGQYAKRTLWHMNHYMNTNEIASNFGHREISAISKAVGFKGSFVFDSNPEKFHIPCLHELFNKPLEIEVTLEEIQIGVFRTRLKAFILVIKQYHHQSLLHGLHQQT